MKARRGRPPRFSPQDQDLLRSLLREDPEHTLVTLALRFAKLTDTQPAPSSTLHETLARMGIHIQRKKPKTQLEAQVSVDPARYQERTPPPELPHRVAYPSDLTDEHWAIIEPLLPPPKRRLTIPRRELLNAIAYVLRTGCQWRQIPHDFPKWNTVYRTHARWAKSGDWARIQQALRVEVRKARGRAPEATMVLMDSQSSKTTEKGGPEVTTRERRSRDENAT